RRGEAVALARRRGQGRGGAGEGPRLLPRGFAAMSERARPVGEAWAPAILAGMALVPFLGAWLKGQLPYWGDLTYIHHPWRAYAAQLLRAGRLPLWNPYLYFGMPQAASMQDGLFYPGTTPFFIFGFPAGLALFHAVHYALAGLMT